MEKPAEIAVGIAARVGIIGLHSLEFIGIGHMVAMVSVLWTLEELVAVRVSLREVHTKHVPRGAMEKRIVYALLGADKPAPTPPPPKKPDTKGWGPYWRSSSKFTAPRPPKRDNAHQRIPRRIMKKPTQIAPTGHKGE